MRRLVLSFSMLALTAAVAPAHALAPRQAAEYRQWIAEMKEHERGPFDRIRWFCSDGAVLPPRPYACSGHGSGEGYQHGELNERARTLRSRGYWIANLLAGSKPAAMVAATDFRERLAQLLIEKYLIGVDDGWILRQAMFYRGAIQEEDERDAARALLLEMIGSDSWAATGYPALRIAARMLPHGTDNTSVQRVRQVSASLSNRDAGFKPLRAKIHGAPGIEDADAVRSYASGLASSRQAPYLRLADEIDRIYQPGPVDQQLRASAGRYSATPWLQELLLQAAERLAPGAPALERYAASADLMAGLRDALPRVRSSSVRLDLLDESLRAERENFRASSELARQQGEATRAERIGWLRIANRASYGGGIINRRLMGEVEHALDVLDAGEVALDVYMDTLEYLARAPGWGAQALRVHFFEGMQKLADIEPKAALFIQDQLRGSPLLFLSRTLDNLTRDANRLAGVKHRLFGEEVGVGFSALNPGLAEGVLHVESDPGEAASFRSDGIYLLPETVADLPPVAGILTGGEGNPLSHIQLLARNLGIPNVTVDESVVPRLATQDGQRVVMAVSKSGLVEIDLWGEQWRAVFEEARDDGRAMIEPNLEKLDLSVRRIVSLDELRATDSGRIVGPKAAKLGELRAHYPGQVSRGVAIPFGVFLQEALERPHPGGEGSVFDWMVRNYGELGALPRTGAERAVKTVAFRSELHSIMLATKPSDGFRQALYAALKQAFGDEPWPGIFVRSDTNVEDLPGFTGAGLNLTLPNVKGFDQLVEGIVRVWASPFATRAFAWRQSRMTLPEHVYSSILLLETVASDKSGVLVTQNIDTGNREVLSVAINEGIGGAVDGQAAESLRIPMDGSRVRVLATATAPLRRAVDPEGGLMVLPVSGRDTVLESAEIAKLVDFARQLPQAFPSIVDDEGNAVPADVEFGFKDGQLVLFQIRPFLESKAARGIAYLSEMEASLAGTDSIMVDLEAVP